MTEKMRPIRPLEHDTGTFTLVAVSEAEIAKFCNGCDFLLPTGICKMGSNDQARYVAREFCGWAQIDGQRGEMTEEGFRVYP